MKSYCNPLDLGYRYQHMKEGERIAGFREGADPTLVYFKGKYYLFVSMSAGFWYSDDLLHWNHAKTNLSKDYPKHFGDAYWVWAPQTIYDRKAKK